MTTKPSDERLDERGLEAERSIPTDLLAMLKRISAARLWLSTLGGSDAFATEQLLSELRAYLSNSAPAGVRVKPLVWDGLKAATPYGVFSISRTPDGYQVSLGCEELTHIGYLSGRPFESALENAKAAAHEYHSAIILSTLEPSPSEPGEVTDAERSAWQSYVEGFNPSDYSKPTSRDFWPWLKHRRLTAAREGGK